MYWNTWNSKKVILYIKVLFSESPKWPQVWITRKTHRTQQKDAKQNQHREKAHGVKSGGSQVQASNSLLPVESHRTCLIPLAMSYYHMCETLSTSEAHLSPEVHSLYWCQSTGTLCFSMYQNFRCSEGKQRLVINHIVCIVNIA